MADSKGMAIAALVLGVLGLFTAGGLGVGSLLGLALAGVALTRGIGAGRDVAWAAIAANTLALATLFPIGVAVWQIRTSPIPLLDVEDNSLPEPAQQQRFVPFEAAPPPPPPPPAVGASRTGATPAAPLRIGGDLKEPRKTRHIDPVYPKDAVQARIQGVVVLECTISPEGRVAQVTVVKGVRLLTEAAVAAVEQWRYTPTLVDDVAVPVIMTVRVNFKLS